MTPMQSPVELRRRGLEILIREMGYADAMRFLLQYESGQGDYTRERQAIIPKWTDEELLREADKLVHRDD